jgi:hypothetical protein
MVAKLGDGCTAKPCRDAFLARDRIDFWPLIGSEMISLPDFHLSKFFFFDTLSQLERLERAWAQQRVNVSGYLEKSVGRVSQKGSRVSRPQALRTVCPQIIPDAYPGETAPAVISRQGRPQMVLKGKCGDRGLPRFQGLLRCLHHRAGIPLSPRLPRLPRLPDAIHSVISRLQSVSL